MGVTILITLRWISAVHVWCSFIEHHCFSHNSASRFLCWKKWWKLIDLMPCVRLSPSTHTIAELNPKHITHSGDLLSLFLHPFSACGLELIQQRLRNRVLNKNRYVYPCVCISLRCIRGDTHTSNFWCWICLQCKLDIEIPYRCCEVWGQMLELAHLGITIWKRWIDFRWDPWKIGSSLFQANGSF